MCSLIRLSRKSRRPGLQEILLAELQRIHPDHLGDELHVPFQAPEELDMAEAAIGRTPGLVGVDRVRVHPGVRDVVRTRGGVRRRAGDVDGVVGVGAGVPVHEQLLRRDPAVGANARLDPIGEGAPAGQQAEFLLAGGLELHGPSVRLVGQAGEEWLEVDAGLAPEATADVRYDDAHLVVGKLEGVTEQVPDGEGRLGARPDGHLVARLPLDDGDVGLQRDVLHRRVGVVALDDPVRLGETGFDVALCVSA